MALKAKTPALQSEHKPKFMVSGKSEAELKTPERMPDWLARMEAHLADVLNDLDEENADDSTDGDES